mmetsp:Transcript_20842/g.21625  ORF Transcript_20842/g.21625 Transcript_20842/m.21625 type:complete len:162 (+) Transcript_20842:123-608(+)
MIRERIVPNEKVNNVNEGGIGKPLIDKMLLSNNSGVYYEKRNFNNPYTHLKSQQAEQVESIEKDNEEKDTLNSMKNSNTEENEHEHVNNQMESKLVIKDNDHNTDGEKQVRNNIEKNSHNTNDNFSNMLNRRSFRSKFSEVVKFLFHHKASDSLVVLTEEE